MREEILVPARKSPGAAPKPGARPDSPWRRTDPDRVATILVVEDDADIRELIIEMLEESGYRVLSAANAEEAMAIVRRDRAIDVLFTDIIMPGRLNGVDLAQAALGVQPHLKLLFASGYASPAVLAPLQHHLSRAFLKKPYRPRELTSRIAALLEN